MRSKHSVDNSFQKKWFHFTFTIGVTERCADAHSVSFWELLMVRAHVEFLFDVSILCDCLVYLHLFTCADAHSVSFWELLMVRAHVEFLFDVSI